MHVRGHSHRRVRELSASVQCPIVAFIILIAEVEVTSVISRIASFFYILTTSKQLIISLVCYRLVSQHNDIIQWLSAIPASNNDKVRSNRCGSVAVPPGCRNANVPVPDPCHVSCSQCHAEVGRLVLLFGNLGLTLHLVL